MLWSLGSVFKWLIVCSSLVKGMCLTKKMEKGIIKRVVMILLVFKVWGGICDGVSLRPQKFC